MHATLSRPTGTDQLVTRLHDACCHPHALCPGCRARAEEVRAARRDAIIHSVRSRRPRRYGS